MNWACGTSRGFGFTATSTEDTNGLVSLSRLHLAQKMEFQFFFVFPELTCVTWSRCISKTFTEDFQVDLPSIQHLYSVGQSEQGIQQSTFEWFSFHNFIISLSGSFYELPGTNRCYDHSKLAETAISLIFSEPKSELCWLTHTSQWASFLYFYFQPSMSSRAILREIVRLCFCGTIFSRHR